MSVDEGELDWRMDGWLAGSTCVMAGGQLSYAKSVFTIKMGSPFIGLIHMIIVLKL